MNHIHARFGAALLALVAGSATALDYQAGTLRIGHPWTRATPNSARVGGGYLTVTNTGPTADRLVGGTLVEASRVEIHQMTMEAGVMKMHPVEGGLEIPPGETVTLKPGGYHMMFMDLKGQFKQGEMIKGTLVFEKAGTVPVEFKVEAIAAGAPGTSHEHH
jgi:periplasmic copper chaperone A